MSTPDPHSEPAGISFVIPVYNKEDWLPAVLDALAAQRGDFAREFIFVDDGSTDASMAVVEARTRGWENVVIVRQANGGSAAATNRGIALARMPYIKFCDADDLLAHDTTQVLLDALKADPQACLAFGGRHVFAERETIDLERPLTAGAVERIEAPLVPALRNSMFNPTQFLVRTAIAQAVGGCDERVVHSQEYSLTLRLARTGPFLRVSPVVAYIPAEVPGRLSARDPGRQLQRVTRAIAYFLADHPDVPGDLVREACRRAAGRAWKYQRRWRGKTFASPWFWRQVWANLRPPADPAYIHACARAFDAPEGQVK